MQSPTSGARDEIRIAEGDYVAAHGYQHATHTGTGSVFPPAEKPSSCATWISGASRGISWRRIGCSSISWAFLEQVGYDIHKVLAFIGSKPPEFFDSAETD